MKQRRSPSFKCPMSRIAGHIGPSTDFSGYRISQKLSKVLAAQEEGDVIWAFFGNRTRCSRVGVLF